MATDATTPEAGTRADRGTAHPAEPGLVRTTTEVLEGAPILEVVHTERGCWRLSGPHGADAVEGGAVIPAAASWTDLSGRDPSLGQVAEIPPGWVARRDSSTGPWRRSPT